MLPLPFRCLIFSTILWAQNQRAMAANHSALNTVNTAINIVSYDQESILIQMDQTTDIAFSVRNIDIKTAAGGILSVYVDNPEIAILKQHYVVDEAFKDYYNDTFTVRGGWLGKTSIRMNLSDFNNNTELIGNPLPITVIREKLLIDQIFTISVAVLISILYINFGCALDWSYLRATIKRPIGPAIGFCTQFILMPILSYLLGLLLFPNRVDLRLGLFFTGVSPAGGASNLWTYILGGNLNLSITMTTISTFAAFGMMPLWIFTLGYSIFHSGNLVVPYKNIGFLAVALVVPLGIGYLIQRFRPGLSKIMVRVLKPFASFLIIFIVSFAIIINVYIFSLFSWQIILAGSALPWVGFMAGMLLSVLLQQNVKDSLAIAIETGVQNTGIAIFLLRFSLPQPEADLTTAVPVAVAIMTPFPLIGLFIGRKVYDRWCGEKMKLPEPEYVSEDATVVPNSVHLRQ